MNDQSFWRGRMQELGVGPRAIPRGSLTAGNLAHAIDQAVHDPAMRAKAARLGECLQAENGVFNAVMAIESLLKG
jgi:sterol 3beta-glucosyltransferase